MTTDRRMEMESLLAVKDLFVSYGRILAVRGVTFHVDAGEIVALLGSNGAGKTSILSSLMGLVPEIGGSARFRGGEILGMKTENIVRQGMTMVPEGRRIFSDLTVAENLRLGAAGRQDRNQLQEDLERVFGLFPILKERYRSTAGTLSGGQQQMLAIGRALMARPKALLLDEPSLGLAPLLVELIFDLIRQLRETGVTILLVEQNAQGALDLADRAYVLQTGRIVLSGSSQEIRESSNLRSAYLGVT
jgi:branched-chain amino acid transport system ATP-binding protein